MDLRASAPKALTAGPDATAPRTGLLASFSKAQVSSAIATGVDFGLLFGLVELLGVWYVAAVAAGSLAGAVCNFVLNRHWSFVATHARWHGQALRYAIVSAVSAALNSGGCYLLTDVAGIHYAASVVGVSLLVGFLFNFPLHRYYVFK